MWSPTLVVDCSEINSVVGSDEDDGAATSALTAESSVGRCHEIWCSPSK
jgi:hypothetical protein